MSLVRITASALALLSVSAHAAAAALPDWFPVEIGGNTDNVGKPDYNMKLSQARADAVRGWLVTNGIAARQLTSRGYGDTNPLVANDTDQHRAQNRRVELTRPHCN